ncbi:hypothetical protein Y032_0059g2993 [Ancylostoma ceylanicum]|uniref:Uncharacterized protein n=1 Tax=Ancylostoma ceylanicum TaxID=53326 RepID=A0A016U4B8_9BILA|nr:hypothetical protein Y032_0059g2993 [Ancylostoma ceylanicum]
MECEAPFRLWRQSPTTHTVRLLSWIEWSSKGSRYQGHVKRSHYCWKDGAGMDTRLRKGSSITIATTVNWRAIRLTRRGLALWMLCVLLPATRKCCGVVRAGVAIVSNVLCNNCRSYHPNSIARDSILPKTDIWVPLPLGYDILCMKEDEGLREEYELLGVALRWKDEGIG